MFSTPQLVLWILLIAGEVAVLGSIAYRRNLRQFPHFSLYIGFCLVRSVALFAIAHTFGKTVYFWAYFVGMAMSSVLVLACIIELLSSLFISKRNVPKFGCCFATLAVACLAASLTLQPRSYSEWVIGFVDSFDRGVAWFILAAFVAVIVRSRQYGIPWRKREFRVAAGLFVAVLGYCLAAMLSSQSVLTPLVRYLHMGAFLIGEALWTIAYLRRDSRLYVISTDQMRRLHNDFTSGLSQLKLGA